MTTRPARSRASVPNILNVVRGVNRKNPASSAPAMRAGSWRLIWKAAKALVKKISHERIFEAYHLIYSFYETGF